MVDAIPVPARYHPSFAAGGPVSFLETSFRVGNASYCGRFEMFKRNNSDLVIAKGPPTCNIGASCGRLARTSGLSPSPQAPYHRTPQETVILGWAAS